MKTNFLKKISRIVLIFLSIGMLFALCVVGTLNLKIGYAEDFSSVSEEQEKEDVLSKMSEDECITFIIEKGVQIPDELKNLTQLGNIIKQVIQTVEKEPNYEFIYNYGIMSEFAENIKEIVNEYYNIDRAEATEYLTSDLTEYTLQDNTVYGEWEDNYPNYNCYSYAIEYLENDYVLDRGRYPGQMSGEYFDLSLSIEEMAQLVKNDLITIGRGDVYVTNDCPTVLSPEESLICISKGDRDYHFMKYHTEGNYWTHKPGGTAVLKYNYQPSNDRIWIGEAVNENGVVSTDSSLRYDSEIYYIIYNWNGLAIHNNIVTGFSSSLNFNEVINIPEGVTGIGDNVFAGTLATNFIIPNSFLSFGNNAFENCTNLTTISGLSNVQTIGAKAFKGCSALTSITLPNTLTEIGEQAFSNCNNLNITISTSNPNYSSENNILYNKNKTQLIQACNIASNIVIIDSVAEILPYAFEGSGNLIEVRFNTTPTIGDYAFANCTNLHTIHFDTYATPTVGTNVFLNDDFVLYVPYTSQEAYKTAFTQYAENVASVEVQVFFVSDGETIDTKTVYDGSVIADLLEPTKTGHDFGGWYSTSDFTGSVYQNGEIWETEVGLTAYAKWTAKQYSVTLNANGGNITGENAINVTYGETFSITSTATREGYTLDGWFDSEGTEYITAEGECTRAWDKDEDTTLYAHWTIKSYEIQINNDGSITWLGKDGLSNDQCSIEYGTVLGSINLVPAYKQSSQGFKAGKIFDHFEYNDTTVNWTSVPDLGEDGAIITIIPVWVLEEHTIYFNALCDIAVTEIVADYNTNIELPNIERTGYIFDGWYDSASGGTPISWVKMPDLTPNAQNNGSIMLYGSWSANNYSVSYNANNGTGMMSPTEFVYDVAQDLRANTFTRTGYDFIGWAITANGTVEYSDGQNVINLTSEQAGQITLYAVWEAKTYSIIAKNLMPSMYIFPNEYTYGEGLSEMPTLYVSGDYYSEEVDEFYGWYTTDTFTVKVESISNTSTGDITVYANYDYWVSSTYASYEDTVTDGNISEQPSFSVNLLLGSYYYDILQNTTLNKIKITFSLSLWETNDGYQDFYLYNGDEVIWEKTIAHGGSEKDTTPRTYGAEDDLEIVLDIEDFKTVDFMDLRLGAHGWFGDTWNFENFEMSIYFTN